MRSRKKCFGYPPNSFITPAPHLFTTSVPHLSITPAPHPSITPAPYPFIIPATTLNQKLKERKVFSFSQNFLKKLKVK